MTAFRPQRPSEVTAGIDSLRSELLALVAVRRPDATQVHRLRVTCKRLRAAVRLLRLAGPAKGWRRCDHALRRVARHYGNARDDQVLRDGIAALATHTRNTAARRACRRLLADLPVPPPAKGCSKSAQQQLAMALQRFDAADCSAATLRAGWRQGFARCRALAAQTLAAATNDNLHRLRKRVKYLGYQVGLAGAGTAELQALQRSLTTLGRNLGTVHDLALLEHRLQRESGPTPASAALVTALAGRRRLALTRQVLRTASTLFALTSELG